MSKQMVTDERTTQAEARTGDEPRRCDRSGRWKRLTALAAAVAATGAIVATAGPASATTDWSSAATGWTSVQNHSRAHCTYGALQVELPVNEQAGTTRYEYLYRSSGGPWTYAGTWAGATSNGYSYNTGSNAGILNLAVPSRGFYYALYETVYTNGRYSGGGWFTAYYDTRQPYWYPDVNSCLE